MKKILFLFLLSLGFTLSAQFHIAWITAEPDTIYDDGNITFSEIEVCIHDENNDPVSGQRVDFDSNLGDCLNYDFTNALGVAETSFWESDDGPGVATIFVFVDGDMLGEIEVTILELVGADDEIPLLINVRNYPNPFKISGDRSNGTTISFSLNIPGRDLPYQQAEISIFNIKAQLIDRSYIKLDPQKLEYSYYWNGNTVNGTESETGIYFYLISAGKKNYKGKMTLIK